MRRGTRQCHGRGRRRWRARGGRRLLALCLNSHADPMAGESFIPGRGAPAWLAGASEARRDLDLASRPLHSSARATKSSSGQYSPWLSSSSSPLRSLNWCESLIFQLRVARLPPPSNRQLRRLHPPSNNLRRLCPHPLSLRRDDGCLGWRDAWRVPQATCAR